MSDKYDPNILRDVSFGLAQGLKGREISDKYDINKNTVSRYKKRLREMNETQIKGIIEEVIEDE